MKKFRLWAKFCVKCFLVLLPLWVVWWYIWAFPLNYVDGEIPYFMCNKAWTAKRCQHQYDVLILGDSATNSAYEPEYLSERTLNLALGGTTPAEMYYVLYNFLQSNPPPKAIYLSFVDVHFHAAECLFSRSIYSHLLSWQQDLEILRQAKKYNNRATFTPTAYKDWFSYRLWLPNKYLPSLLNAAFRTRKNTNEKVIQSYTKHRGTYISHSVGENQNYNINKFVEYKIHPFLDTYFRKILQLCTKEGIIVHIIMPPVIPSVHKTDNYQKELQTYYDRLKADYPTITFLDRMDDFEWRHLQDQHHFNIHGALKFTKAIKSLYPEDFADAANDPVSRNTIDGMTDYLQMENYPGEILRRLEDTNFSAVLIRWPEKGGQDEDLLAAVKECYPAMADRIAPLAANGGEDAAVFFVNGQEKDSNVEQTGNEFSLSDARTQEPLRLHIENDTKATIHLPWQADPLVIDPKLVMDMTVVILNHYDNKVVAVKHFAFSHGSYQLITEK